MNRKDARVLLNLIRGGLWTTFDTKEANLSEEAIELLQSIDDYIGDFEDEYINN